MFNFVAEKGLHKYLVEMLTTLKKIAVLYLHVVFDDNFFSVSRCKMQVTGDELYLPDFPATGSLKQHSINVSVVHGNIADSSCEAIVNPTDNFSLSGEQLSLPHNPLRPEKKRKIPPVVNVLFCR